MVYFTSVLLGIIDVIEKSSEQFEKILIHRRDLEQEYFFNFNIVEHFFRCVKGDSNADKVLHILKKNFCKIETNNQLKPDFNNFLSKICNKAPYQPVKKERYHSVNDRTETFIESHNMHIPKKIHRLRINNANPSLTTSFSEENGNRNINNNSSFFEEHDSNKSKNEIHIINQSFQNEISKVRSSSPLDPRILKPPRPKESIRISESLDQFKQKVDPKPSLSELNLKRGMRPSSPSPFRLSLPRDNSNSDVAKNVETKINSSINLINDKNQINPGFLGATKVSKNLSKIYDENKKEFFGDNSSLLEKIVPKPPNVAKQLSDKNFRFRLLPTKPSKPIDEDTKEKYFVRKPYIKKGREQSSPSPDQLNRFDTSNSSLVLQENMNKNLNKSNFSDNILFQKAHKDKILNLIPSMIEKKQQNVNFSEEKGPIAIKRFYNKDNDKNHDEGQNERLLEILCKEDNMVRLSKPKGVSGSSNFRGSPSCSTNNGKKPKMFNQN